MADVTERIGKHGETYITVKFNAEETEALEKACEIISQRYLDRGRTLTKEEERSINASCQGVLRFEGIDALLEYARTTKLAKPKKIIATGYANFKEVEGEGNGKS